MRGSTTNRYIRTITRLISFTLRAQLGRSDDSHPSHLPQIHLALPISDVAKHLLTLLSVGTPGVEESQNAIHQLIIAILSQNREIPPRYQCPGYYFIIFDNVRLSGQIKDVQDIETTLSEIKWPLRASAFWEIFQQSASIPNGDRKELEE
jgi:hypothetical protein